jgi:serine protease AprX
VQQFRRHHAVSAEVATVLPFKQSMNLRLKGQCAGAVLVAALVLSPIAVNAPRAQALSIGQRLSKLDTLLRADVTARRGGSRRVIIRARPGDRPAIQRLLAASGHATVADGVGDTLRGELPADVLEELATSNRILGISADAVVRPSSDLLGSLLKGVTGTLLGTVNTLTTTTVKPLLNTVGNLLDPSLDTGGEPVPPQVLRQTLALHDGWSGNDVTVAVIDSGLEMSSEFQGRVKAFYDFTSGKTLATTPSDEYGHGTHVAGTIAGSGALSNRKEYRGIAPSVDLVILKVLDGTGAGYTSDVVRAIDFAVTNRDRFGIDIINLSLGHPIYEPAATDPLVQAVERASAAGIVVIAAAGNQGLNEATGQPGYAGITSPGNAPSAITVGAVATSNTVSRRDDRIPDYSSAGPTWYDGMVKPDLLAPGHRIIAVAAKKSAIYKTYPELRAADPDYIRLSGTSMATAVASGVVALMIDGHRSAHTGLPELTPNAVKAMLEYSAIGVQNGVGLEYDPLRQGAGALNGGGAVALARAADTSTGRGGFWLNPQPSPWTRIGNDDLTWGQAVIWGNAVIWGSTIPVNQAAWSNAVIWGSNTKWSYNYAVIWGSNVVWTDPQSWSNAVIWGSDAIGTTDGSAVIWGSTNGLNAQNTAWKDLDDGGPKAQ